MRLRCLCLLVLALMVLPLLPPNAHAASIIGPDLSTFAILGGAGVALNGTGNTIFGSVGGCCNAFAVTGVIPTNFTIAGGTVQQGGGVATNAQGELTTAIGDLGLLGPPTLLAGSLGTLTLAPGVYSFSSTALLTGALTLDGGGNANAVWVFEVPSALTAAIGSSVNVIGTGSGAGVYWNVGSSATLDGATFEGNVLANQSITVGTGVTDSCGRLLTQVASVTLAGTDNISIGCSGSLAGSNGLSGGLTVPPIPPGGGSLTTPTPLPFSAVVPEPSTFLLLGSGLVGLVGTRMRQARARTKKS
jgi:Ice-binding-like/PEP-CTERM motif